MMADAVVIPFFVGYNPNSYYTSKVRNRIVGGVMKERQFARRLTNAIFKINGIENSIDQEVAVGYAQLCLLYALDDGKPHSQKQICELWGISRTTMNTIVKKWEKEEILSLNKIPGKRREMEITLTAKGCAFADGALEKVYYAEETAMKKTVEKYSAVFVEALEYYAEALLNADMERRNV